MWDEITYSLLKFIGATVEVLDWISNFTPHFIFYFTYDYLSMLVLKLTHVSERGHSCTDISWDIRIPQNAMEIDGRLVNGFKLQQGVACTILIKKFGNVT